MSIRVVTNSHLTGDDTTLVPSIKEFKALQAENSQLKRKLTAIKSSASSLERTLKSLQSNVTPLKTTLRTLRQDIKNELSDGEWKKILEREARAATQQLETSMSCLSAVKASLISEGIAEKMGKEQSVERTSKTPTRRIASGVDTKKAKTTTKSSIRKKNKKK